MSLSAHRVLGWVCLAGALAFSGACSSSEPPAAPADVPDAAAPPIATEAGSAPRAGDASVDASPPPATGPGSGGKGGLACTSHDDLGGSRRSCVAKVGSVEVKLVEPLAGTTGALRLGLYTHGDGAAAHKSNGVLKAMIPWADAHHGLAVSVLAPNGCAWWLSPTHDCAGTTTEPDTAGENAAALVVVLDAIMKAYDVRTDGLRYYGSSGGSIFLTDEWIPLQGGKYPGVFALMCGGDVSARTYGWDTTNAVLRAKNPLWFTYGDQDFLLTDITAAESTFKGKGFALTDKVIPGVGHCEFDAHGEATGIWSANP